MLRLIEIALLLSTATLCAACAQPLSADECNQLLDHYSEALARQRRPDVSDDELGRIKREARQKAAVDREFLRCGAKVSRRQWACAMAAPSTDEIERCLL